jgi:hypothetical protein
VTHPHECEVVRSHRSRQQRDPAQHASIAQQDVHQLLRAGPVPQASAPVQLPGFFVHDLQVETSVHGVGQVWTGKAEVAAVGQRGGTVQALVTRCCRSGGGLVTCCRSALPSRGRCCHACCAVRPTRDCPHGAPDPGRQQGKHKRVWSCQSQNRARLASNPHPCHTAAPCRAAELINMRRIATQAVAHSAAACMDETAPWPAPSSRGIESACVSGASPWAAPC